MDSCAILGVGLIGGSIAVGVRRVWPSCHIIGVDVSFADLKKMVSAGLLDEGAADYACLANADVIFLAVPPKYVSAVMQSALPYLKSSAVFTDVTSVKRSVVEAARLYLSEVIDRFVPGHPIAGSEHVGWHFAQADLFQGRQVVLTPLKETSIEAIKTVEHVWHGLGAQVVSLDPEEHDKIFAAVSHLPHVLAFALMAAMDNTTDYLNYAGLGFLDMTRIAASSPSLWQDICLANRDALLESLLCCRHQIDEAVSALQTMDSNRLEALFARGSAVRARWLENYQVKIGE